MDEASLSKFGNDLTYTGEGHKTNAENLEKDISVTVADNDDDISTAGKSSEGPLQHEEVLPEIFPHMDLESMLAIPSTILFPMELSRYLKHKLTAVVEDNWHLQKHVKCQETELNELRKLGEISKDPTLQYRKESPTVLSGKIIDLSKKNRDMTTQIESIKVKMQQVLAENETLKRKICADHPPPSLNGSGDTASLDGSGISEASGINQQLTKTTNKMMEYRQQNQILQMELRTALRALCQEVGEGTTVKTVLKEVAGPESSWRGRQQQIISLTQKVSDLQLKLAQANQQVALIAHQQELESVQDGEDDPSQGLHVFHVPNVSRDMGGGGDNSFRYNVPAVINPSAKRQVSMLQHCEKKKQNQMETVKQTLEATKNELKTAQLEAKGSKARTLFLESQVRSLRVDLDEVGIKVQSKQDTLQQAQDEIRELRQELLAVREREKRHREASSSELHDATQALGRERGVVSRLQKLIVEKQDHLQKLDSKVARLQDDVHSQSSSTNNILEYTDKIKSLENQLQVATQSIHVAEKERERLLTLISNSVGEAQQERQSHSEADRLLSRALGILSLTDSCINRCLDAGGVTSKPILEEVEEIRALVRELKAGTNHSFEVTDRCRLVVPQASQSTPLMTSGPQLLKFEPNHEMEIGNKPKTRLPQLVTRQQVNSRK